MEAQKPSPQARTARLNTTYLAAVCKAVGADKSLTITVDGELDPVWFETESEHGTVTMLVMPMRR